MSKQSEKLQVLRVNSSELELADIHAPKKPGDVGFDLSVSEDFTIPPIGNGTVIVPSAVKVKIPDGHWAQIVGRSSTAKRGLAVVTATIDEHYTGQLFACVHNLTTSPIQIKKGERLAQVVFFKSIVPEILEVGGLPETERGETGFGSTNT